MAFEDVPSDMVSMTQPAYRQSAIPHPFRGDLSRRHGELPNGRPWHHDRRIQRPLDGGADYPSSAMEALQQLRRYPSVSIQRQNQIERQRAQTGRMADL
jgi:hypothetical protein